MPTNDQLARLFDDEALQDLFPAGKADQFFEALLGDAEEGAFDISLGFEAAADRELRFELQLRRRPGKCLACSLTYGLPQVFTRHPVIDLNGLVRSIDKRLDGSHTCTDWRLGRTREISPDLHAIPLHVTLSPKR